MYHTRGTMLKFEDITSSEWCALGDVLNKDQAVINNIVLLARQPLALGLAWGKLGHSYDVFFAMQANGNIDVEYHVIPALVIKHGTDIFRYQRRLRAIAQRV